MSGLDPQPQRPAGVPHHPRRVDLSPWVYVVGFVGMLVWSAGWWR